jgi:hypothetical protein
MTSRKKLHRAAFGGDADRDASGRFVRNEMARPKRHPGRTPRGWFPLAALAGVITAALWLSARSLGW